MRKIILILLLAAVSGSAVAECFVRFPYLRTLCGKLKRMELQFRFT